MNSVDDLQDVIRCDLCETPVPFYCCDICHTNLCKTCVGGHMSDRSTEHNVIPFEERKSTITCAKHSVKKCELHCEHCNIPICSSCISSNEHDLHKKIDITENFKSKRKLLQRDIQEIGEVILPEHKHIMSRIQRRKDDLREYAEDFKRKLKEEEEDKIQKIREATKNHISIIDAKIVPKHLNFLNACEKKYHQQRSEIKKHRADMNELQSSDDKKLISLYESKNQEFRRFPENNIIPSYEKGSITIENYEKEFSSKLSKIKTPLGEPKVITNIITDHGQKNTLFDVSCQNDSEFWVCGNDKNIRLYNLKGELLKNIETISGNSPTGISLTRRGDLLYTHLENKTINIVTKDRVEVVVKLHEWKPLNVCSTSGSSGDFLVIMNKPEQTKVVRYSGSTVKKTIQYDNNHRPLFSVDETDDKFICENGNQDICVSDMFANEIVVVSSAGNPRFTYIGSSSPHACKNSFFPIGITTDSQNNILTADRSNHCIHIVDEDGQFLRYIDNCDLNDPWGVCLDSKDNLFVVELSTGHVKKIKYFK